MTTAFLTDKNVTSVSLSSRKWLFSPAFDLLFICGGSVMLLYGAHVLAATSGHGTHRLEFLATVQALGTLFLSQTHTVSSFFLVGDLDARGKMLARGGALGFVLLALFALTNPLMPGVLAKLYLFIVAHHFLSQSYGIFKLYCLKADFVISAQLNKLIKVIIGLTATYWCSTLLTAHQVTQVFLLQELPEWPLLPAQFSATLLEVLILLCTYFVARLVLDFCRGERVPPFPAVVMLSFCVVLFMVPEFIQDSIWLYAPAFFHGVQYLAVLYKRLSARSAKHAGLTIFKSALIGAAVFLGLPCLLSATGVAYGAALAVIFVVLQFQHVLVDGLAWRLSRLKSIS